MGRSSTERHHERPFIRILGGGQVDAEAAAAVFGRQANGFATMASGDLAHQRQTKPTAPAVLADLRQTIERLENPFAFGRRHAGPMIGDFEHGTIAFAQ